MSQPEQHQPFRLHDLQIDGALPLSAKASADQAAGKASWDQAAAKQALAEQALNEALNKNSSAKDSSAKDSPALVLERTGNDGTRRPTTLDYKETGETGDKAPAPGDASTMVPRLKPVQIGQHWYAPDPPEITLLMQLGPEGKPLPEGVRQYPDGKYRNKDGQEVDPR